MSTYSYDWTTPALPNFLRIKSILKQVNNVLEIGSFEGRSTCWFLNHLLSDTGTVTCIDPFLHLDTDYFSNNSNLETKLSRRNIFLEQTAQIKNSLQTVRLLESRSYHALSVLIQEKQLFDFIYIDGNHSAESIMADAVMSFGLLRTNGIMLLDDYLLDNSQNWFYQHKPKESLTSAKQAIDSFLEIFKSSIVRIPLKNNYQVAVYKK